MFLYLVVETYNMKKIDFTQLITKEVLSNDMKHVGHVDGLDDRYFIVKEGLFKPKYYKIPREKVISYQHGKVLLDISEQDAKKQFRRKYPGYFKNIQNQFEGLICQDIICNTSNSIVVNNRLPALIMNQLGVFHSIALIALSSSYETIAGCIRSQYDTIIIQSKAVNERKLDLNHMKISQNNMSTNKRAKSDLKMTANNFDKRVKEITRYIPEDPRSNFINNWKTLKSKMYETLEILPD